MSGIDDGHTQISGIPELVVFYIRGDEGIAACTVSIHQLTAAGTAAYADLANRFATISIAKTGATQGFLHLLQEGFQRLLFYETATQQAVFPSLCIGTLRIHHLHIRKTQYLCQGVVDAAGCQIQIGVGIDAGDAMLNEKECIFTVI